MPTNKITLRTTEEFMSGYTPTYSPIYGLFLDKSQQYEREAGRMDFRKMTAVGDVRAHHITPKDTEIRQVSVSEGKKAFRKYFLANQFTISEFQDQQGVEDVTAQVLDEHHLQADELLMFGDGTSPSNVVNNGLYYSADPNYTLLSSIAIPSTDRLYAFHDRIIATARRANQVAGRKVIFIFGDGLSPLVNALYPTAVRGWKTALLEVLGPNYSVVELPVELAPSGDQGWMIVNMDQIKLHYTVLPELMAQGVNEENMYAWFNFLMGSMMVDVMVKDAIIRQPATLAV